MVVQFVVFGCGGEKMIIDAAETVKAMQQMSVLELKKKIAEKHPDARAGSMMSNMKLVYGDKSLDADSKLLSEYGVNHKSTIQMVMSLDGGTAERET